MRHIVIVSDSFKGAITSREAHDAIAAGVRRALPEVRITAIPVADGGEGTVDAMLAAGGGDITVAEVCGVFPGERVRARYGRLDSRTAVVEMAECAGLPLADGRQQTEEATTYGVGQLIRAAVEAGCRHVIVGAGGSATTDLGCGAASALGVIFRNAEGEEFVPVGRTLSNVASIDTSSARSMLENLTLTVMCDIDNPLVGTSGAAHVFGPQKGADAATVQILDEGLSHVASLMARDHGIDIADVPGAGAAGGLAGGLMAFCGATLKPGIDAVLEAADFAAVIADADLIITGEGRIDGQSLSGKVPVGVARWAKQYRDDLPVVVLAGSIGAGIEEVYGEGITAVFPIGRRPESLRDAIEQTEENLAASAYSLVNLCSTMLSQSPYSRDHSFPSRIRPAER